MTPKKKKQPPKTEEPELEDFVSLESRGAFSTLIKRKVILERGIMTLPPFEGYIKKHGWENFCEAPGEANITLATEFYANLCYQENPGFVLCRGKLVPFSFNVINEYFNLPTETSAYVAYNKLKAELHWIDDDRVGDWDNVVREITKPEVELRDILRKDKWSNIDKKHLTTEMNVWYTFIAAILLPVTINSEVHWERIRLLYAIKKGLKINVGKTIFSSIINGLKTSSGIGFHSLVTGICRRAGCLNKGDDAFKPPMSMLTYEAFSRRVKVFQPTLNTNQSGAAGSNPMEGLPDVDPVNARLERIEMCLNGVKQFCEHLAKVVSYNSPEAIEKYGKFPGQMLEIDDHEQTNREQEIAINEPGAVDDRVTPSQPLEGDDEMDHS